MGNGTFLGNAIIAGTRVPTRAYINGLVPEVIEGRIQPGLVFDRELGPGDVPDGCRAMNELDALKVLVRP